MPSPIAVSATMGAVRELADRALTRSDGLIIRYFVVKYGTMLACHEAARSFQTTFSALRARERRLKQRRAFMETKMIDTTMLGTYDALSCNKRTLPDNSGVMIIMCRQATIAYDLDVVDLTTGEALEDFTPDNKKLNEVLALFFAMDRKSHEEHVAFTDPLSIEDREWFFTVHPETAAEFYENAGLAIPTLSNQRLTLVDSKSDPIDIPMDVDLFTGKRIVVDN